MTATRAPRPIPLSISAEDLLVAAAIIAALGDRPGRLQPRRGSGPIRCVLSSSAQIPASVQPSTSAFSVGCALAGSARTAVR